MPLTVEDSIACAYQMPIEIFGIVELAFSAIIGIGGNILIGVSDMLVLNTFGCQ